MSLQEVDQSVSSSKDMWDRHIETSIDSHRLAKVCIGARPKCPLCSSAPEDMFFCCLFFV